MPLRIDRTKRLTLDAFLVTLALIFSYVEVLLPFFPGLPGVKLGLANLVVLIALYRLGAKDAFLINLVRILLAGLLFAGAYGLLYSLAGGIFSFLVMVVLKNTGHFSVPGVSMAGGVAHNLAQLAVAMLMVQNVNLLFYYPVLVLSGIVTGILIGIGAVLLSKYLHRLS
ncbi:MAG: Gx transporter family protein [Lachnospiraceae bacterium]|nr:Gx transporter family protein [Lachnospiraceae bacterium]